MFYVFLTFQLATLFVLKNRLIKTLKYEVMQSRGILNLVPQSFFKEHQGAIEKVIKMMKT